MNMMTTSEWRRSRGRKEKAGSSGKQRDTTKWQSGRVPG